MSRIELDGACTMMGTWVHEVFELDRIGGMTCIFISSRCQHSGGVGSSPSGLKVHSIRPATTMTYELLFTVSIHYDLVSKHESCFRRIRSWHFDSPAVVESFK